MIDSKELCPEEYSEIFAFCGDDQPGIKPGDLNAVRCLKYNMGLFVDDARHQFVGASLGPKRS